MREPSALITEAHGRARDLYGAAIGRQDVEAITPALVVDSVHRRRQPRDPPVEAAGPARPGPGTRQEPQEPPYRPDAAGARRVRPVHRHRLGGDRDGARRRRRHPHREPARPPGEAAGGRAPRPGRDAACQRRRYQPTSRRYPRPRARQARRWASWSRWTPAWAALAWMTRTTRCEWRAGSSELPGLRMDGLSGYEGHCSTEPDRERRHALQQQAMAYLVSVADHLEASGIACPILSAAGTATAFWTGSDPRITELQLGSYAAMDSYHYLMEPTFRIATYAVATVISRHPAASCWTSDARPSAPKGSIPRTRHGSAGTMARASCASTRSTRSSRSRGRATSVSAMSSVVTSAIPPSLSTTSTHITSPMERPHRGHLAGDAPRTPARGPARRGGGS